MRYYVFNFLSPLDYTYGIRGLFKPLQSTMLRLVLYVRL